MQIHELTQPRKNQIDEVTWVGPGGIADTIGSTVDNIGSTYRRAKTALLNPKDTVKSFVPGKIGKAAQQKISQANADADQAILNKKVSDAIDAGNAKGLGQKPTIDSAKKKIQANPVAQQWIIATVAKWPEAAKKPKINTLNPDDLEEAQVSRRRGSTSKAQDPRIVQPHELGPAARAQLAAQGHPEFQTPQKPIGTDPKQDLRKDIKSWINSQLKTTSLEAIVNAENAGFEGLAGTSQLIKTGLDNMVKQDGDIPAQQETLKNILIQVTAANHLIDWERRTGGGNNLRYRPNTNPDQSTNNTQDPINTVLSPADFFQLSKQARNSGQPAPTKTTGNEWMDNLVQRIWNGR